MFFAWMTHSYSWHGAFFLSGISIIALALVTQFTIGEVDYPIIEEKSNKKGSKDLKNLAKSLSIMFSNKVFVMCLFLGILETAANLSQGVFIPIYFTDVMEMDTVTKGVVLSLKGFAYIPICFIVPILADRFSIKKLLTATFVFAFIAPFSAFAFTGTKLSVFLLILLGSWAEVTVTIFAYMIPRRVLPEALHAEANGIILGSSIIVGGCIAPVALSSLIDAGYSVVTVLGICSFFMFICIFLSAFIPLSNKRRR